MICRMKGLILGLAACFALSGCITLSDVATGVGATGGAVVSSVAALDPVTTAVVTVAGATVGAAVIEDTVQTVTADVIKEVTNPWQAFALAFQALLNHAFEIVIAIAVGVFAIPMVLTFAVGKIMPRKKEKETIAENEVLKRLMKQMEK